MPNLILKIDVTKLKKEWLFRSTKSAAVYADLVLYENDAPDEYGNTHAIKQNPNKEGRERGEKGHYVGNGKPMQARAGQPQRQAPAPRPQQRQAPPQRPHQEPTDYADDSDEIPF